MRVAHIITRLILGGAQENTLYNVDDQHHLFGDEVCLISGPGLGPEGSLEQKALDRQLDLRIIPELQRSLNVRKDLRALSRISEQLRSFQPQIVHTHSSKAGILGRYAAFRLGLPAVHSIHGASFHFGQSPLLHRAYRISERIAARWCDHFISVCDDMSRQYVEAGVAPPERFSTVYSGMDVDRFLTPERAAEEVRRQLGIESHHVVIGKVARLFNLKGHEFLIEAAPAVVRRVPNVRFLLVGDGILREQLQQRIAELGLTNHFIFAGLVPSHEVPDYLHAMDMVVHTSVWEGLARVLPQALISGKPVISYAIDGAPEVCINGETGLLVPPRTSAELSEAMICLAENPSLRAAMGNNGRERFADQFRHETMTARIREVYEMVLRQRQKPAV
ncbi:MAG: glycosyltransferase family 4 protein [Planctomyces sp.]